MALPLSKLQGKDTRDSHSRTADFPNRRPISLPLSLSLRLIKVTQLLRRQAVATPMARVLCRRPQHKIAGAASIVGFGR